VRGPEFAKVQGGTAVKSSQSVFVLLVCALFVSSAVPAFAGNSCTDTAWLIKAYNDALYRAPSNQEISSWIDPQTRLLVQGATRFEAFWAIETNLEGQVDYLGGNPGVVAGYFQLVLGRAPSDDELNTFIGQLQIQQGNAADFALIALLMGGKLGNFSYANEFTARAIALNPAAAACDPNQAIVDQIFHVYLGRDPRRDELTAWVPVLAKGADLQEVALGISGTLDLNVGQGTGEYFNNVVRDAFSRILHRAPTPQELVNWSNALAQRGLNQELYAILTEGDEYCSGNFQIQPSVIGPTPQLSLIQNLSQNVVGPPPQFSLDPPPKPNVVAANGLVLNLQNHVVAQDVTIARLGGGVVINKPPGSIDSSTSGSSATAGGGPAGGTSGPDVGQLLTDLTAEVGGLTTTISAQQVTISAQQQQNAQQQTTINSLVAAEFGLGVDSDAAEAARAAAYQEIQLASASASTKLQKKRLELAQAAASRGDDALAEGDPDDALEDYRAAFHHAALVLGVRLGGDRN
jgi:hypothetical protein